MSTVFEKDLIENSFIGNDIVDLNLDNVLEKYLKTRFVNRVLASVEMEYLDLSADPGLLLWYLWTAKEAAYKAMKKFNSDTVFSHKEFKVIIANPNDFLSLINKKAHIKYGDEIIVLDWQSSSDWVHCNAIFQIDKSISYNIFDYKIMRTSDVLNLSDSFNEEEKLSIYSEQSKAVRTLTKVLLHQNGLEGAQIIRKPLGGHFAPPQVYKNSLLLSNWDLSMTHDGEFVACSVLKL